MCVFFFRVFLSNTHPNSLAKGCFCQLVWVSWTNFQHFLQFSFAAFTDDKFNAISLAIVGCGFSSFFSVFFLFFAAVKRLGIYANAREIIELEIKEINKHKINVCTQQKFAARSGLVVRVLLLLLLLLHVFPFQSCHCDGISWNCFSSVNDVCDRNRRNCKAANGRKRKRSSLRVLQGIEMHIELQRLLPSGNKCCRNGRFTSTRCR